MEGFKKNLGSKIWETAPLLLNVNLNQDLLQHLCVT